MRRLAGFLFILSLLPLAAQHPADSVRAKYIKKYPDKFFLWPVIKRRVLSFQIEHPGTPGAASLEFLPNTSVSVGIGVYVFDVSVELSAAVPVNEGNRMRYGISDTRDLSTTIMGSNWSLDAVTQRYSAFYLSNPAVAPPANRPFPLRPDIDLSNTGVNGIYVFNKHKFSLWSAYNHSERQIQARGSVLLAGTINNVSLTADSLVLSPESLSRLRTTNNFEDIRYATFGLAPGYSYTFIWKRLFFNLSASVGPAHHWVYYKGSDGLNHYDISINSYADSRVAFGYNSDRWFGGISFVSQLRSVKFEEILIGTQSMAFRMVAGYRLDEKGLLKKTWRDFFPEHWRKYLH